MYADHCEKDAGNDEDVQGEEAGERVAADDGPPEHEADEWASDERDAAEDGGADAEAPVGVLVEAQDLAGEGHAEGEQEEEDADDPGKLAGELVGSEEEDLHHMDEDDGDHEVGAPAVHGAEEPTELDVMVEELEAVPGVACGGGVDEREQDASHDLQEEDDRGCAAEDVPPTGGVGWDFVFGYFDEWGSEAETGFKPVVDLEAALF